MRKHKFERAVVFDLDGTLVDSRADLALAVNLTRHNLGLPALAVDTVAAHVGNGIGKLVERSLRDAAEPVDLAHAVELTRRHYAAHLLDNTRLYPGVAAALGELRRRGFALSVVTNKPEAPAREILDGLGIAGEFSAVVGADTCSLLKPDPAPVLLALKLSAAAPQNSWMVGDNWTDLAAGRAAGLRCCFCTYGFGQAGDEKFQASASAAAELPELLAALPG